MIYREKYKDPRWQKKRLEIFSRDNFTCRKCESKDKTLHLHHLQYIGRDPWDTPNEMLITFCEDCHEIVSKISKLLDEAAAQLDADGKEVLLGYASGMILIDALNGVQETESQPITLLSAEYACGLADWVGLTEKELTALTDDNGKIKFLDLKTARLRKLRRSLS